MHQSQSQCKNQRLSYGLMNAKMHGKPSSGNMQRQIFWGVTLGQGIPYPHGCLQLDNLNTMLAQKINGKCN